MKPLLNDDDRKLEIKIRISDITLNDKVGKVYMQECPLYSSVLKVAGRVDCIAEFDGELAIVDFKTSGRTYYERLRERD
jgi:ATP-dependent exoDNAse (exonuclease V) beta subunit